MTYTPDYISQRQFLVEVSDDAIPGYWMQKSGGNVSADANKVYGGGSKTPFILTGIPNVDNVTIARAFDAARDTKMLNDIREQVGVLETSLSVTEVDNDFNAITDGQTVYSPAVLVGISEPEYESTSADAAMVQLEFAVVSVAKGV